jgi:hypothetical protein
MTKSELAAEFEAKLLALVREYGVTLTSEDGMVGYTSPFAAVNLSYSEDGPSPYWPPTPKEE